MKRMTMLALGLAAAIVSACGGSDVSAEAQRARDLQMALQAQQMRNPQFASPTEMGLQQPQGGGQWVYVPQGYAPPAGAYPQAYPAYPAQPQPVYAPAPRTVYRTASVGRASAPAPAPRTTRVTHTKRDAVIGAAAGAVAGAAIDRSVKGAIIGAAAGGVLGAVVGSTIDVDHR